MLNHEWIWRRRVVVEEPGVWMTAPSLENHNYIGDYKNNFFLAQLNRAQKIIMLINVKMPTIVGILTFIFMIYI